jgi:hypothetical protein
VLCQQQKGLEAAALQQRRWLFSVAEQIPPLHKDPSFSFRPSSSSSSSPSAPLCSGGGSDGVAE